MTAAVGQSPLPASGQQTSGGGSRLQSLHPGWGAAVMGTAIVAVATYENPGDVEGLRPIAQAAGSAIAVLAYLLAGVLIPAYGLRWIRYRSAMAADFRHPVLGALFGTVPGALLVLGAMTAVVGPSMLPATVVVALVSTFTLVGGVLAFVVSVAFTVELITGEVTPAAVNGGWFIPPVVAILVPIGIVWLVPHTSADALGTMLAVGYAFFGVGFLVFLLVMAQLYGRLVLHPLPGAPLAPSLWIGLGPVGAGALSMLALSRSGSALFGSSALTLELAGRVAATALWGFGVWWLGIASALTVRYVRTGGMPFSLGWWAFTFPLGAFTVATLTLARLWGSPLLEWFGAGLFVVVIGFWGTVSVRTLSGVWSGSIWRR